MPLIYRGLHCLEHKKGRTRVKSRMRLFGFRMTQAVAYKPVEKIDRKILQSLKERFAEQKDLVILDEDDVEVIRKQLRKHPNDRIIVTQAKGQTDMLPTEADISIVGGSRGGGKSYVLLMNALYDITNPNFRAIIFRKDLDDLSDIIDTSQELYDEFGTFNRAKNDLTWNFRNGGWLTFSYHNMEYADFHDRYQGKQYPYIAIDEVTQMSYKKFKVLTMSNRSAYGIPTRIVGSCNPDPDSWVAKFIEWYIDQETGLPIPERAGVIRYCCMLGDDISQVSWGATREECYEKNRAEIEAMWKPEYNEFGSPQDLFIRSATFIPAKLTDNHALMDNNPEYLGILFNQDDETKARFLDGNWKYKAAGDDIIKLEHMERFYNNAEQLGDKTRYVTCDAAFDGGDKCVFWLWVGNHIADVEACSKDAKATVQFTRELLERWRVREDHFAYDLLGVGHVFKGFFPKALPFNAKEAVEDKYKGMYFNLKAQCFTYFADHIKDGTYSIAPFVLEKRYSGKNYTNKPIRELLNEERRCIRFREDDPTRVIDKAKGMKKIIHRSPDWIEAATIREIFNIKHIHHKPKNLGLIAGSSERQARRQGFGNPFGSMQRTVGAMRFGANMFNKGRRW